MPFLALLILRFLLNPDLTFPCAEAPKIPDNFRDTTWLKLQKAVNSIHQRAAVDYSLEELYVVRPVSLVLLGLF